MTIPDAIAVVILPLPDGLTLRVGDGVAAEVGHAFADTFARAWAAIPSTFRARMLAHWAAIQKRREAARRRRAPTEECAPPVPSIELVAEPLDRFVAGGRRRQRFTATQGLTSACGAELRFLAPFVAVVSPAAVAALVAHELAHVFVFAIEYRSPFVSRLDAVDHEVCAESFAYAWGFDIDGLAVDEVMHVVRWSRGLPIKRKRALKTTRVKLQIAMARGQL